MRSMPSRLIAPVALLATLTVPTPAAQAQQLLATAERPAASAPVRADSQPETPAPAKAPRRALHPLGFTLSGYVETAYNYAHAAASEDIAGRLYERSANQFAFNALKLSLDRPMDPLRFDLGFHSDIVFGENARVLQSTGFRVGRDGDVYQLYGAFNIPTPDHNGVQVKLGRMATFLGYEVIETPLNPNVSVGNAFLFAENFTQTGVSVEHRFNAHVDAQFRVLNGWDQVSDVNGRPSYMARIGLSPDAETSVALAAFTGPEAPENNTALRSGVEVVASHKFGRVTTFVQGDYGHEQRNSALPDPTRNATWWAAGTWLVVEHLPKVGFALRADYMNDRLAARSGAAYGLNQGVQNRLASATGTINIRAIPHLLLRPELRFDRASRRVFDGLYHQTTAGLSAAFLF